MNPDFTLELTGRLCLTLLHSLWQVAVLTFLVWCLERCVRSLTVERRYTLHAGALILAMALLPVTFLLTDAPIVPQAIEVSVASGHVEPAPIFEVPEANAVVAAPGPVTITTPVVAPSAPPLPSPVIDAAVEPAPVEDAPSGWVTFAPWIAGAYAVGVLAMFARLLLSIGRAQRLKSRAVSITTGPLVDKLCELSDRLSLRVRPLLAQAERVVVPQLVGLIRPTILLPTAAINGLSVDDLEMILLHELAHVRRHDLWINLLQRLAEVVLFFNPALWYLSRRISSLREYCCDELTCNTAADPDTTLRTRYATALVRVAELSQSSRRPATANELATLASTGRTPSELRRRIAHLLGEPMHEPLGLTRGTIIAAAVVLLGMSTFLLTSAETADDESQETAQAEPTFSFGGKVEEVTIGTQDEEPQQWWDAEGQVLASPSFTWEKSGNVSADSMIQRRVAFRVDDLPEDAQVLWTIDVASAFATGRATTSEPRPNSQYFARSFGLSNDARTFNIRIGVATGPWKTAAQMDAASNSSLGSHDLSLTCSGAVLTEQGTMAVISHNDSDHNIRIVAVDKQGNLHDSRTRGQVGAGKITQMTLLFPDQLPDDIDHFEFQTRDYEWVEINDLPLHPKDDDNATNIPARTLQFPEDRAIGAVLSRPAADSGFGFEDDPWDGWQELSLAQGVVSIPAGQHVQLNVSRAASADLTPLADLPPDAIESLSLKETDVTDDGLKHIAHLTGLRFLNLDNTRITDKALAHLKNLHQLQTLYLSAYDVFLEGYGVGDEGMKTIAQLPALENVGLRRTKITDGGLDALAECETLQGLDLDETAVTDAGLVPLLKLPQLRGLTLRFYYGFNDPGITDAALLTLRQMQTLRYLDLHGVPITNDGLQQLAGLTKLKRLSINNTQVTGEGLVHLANMQKLEHLYFYDRIDDETVKNVSRLKGLKNLSCNLEVSDKGVAELSTLPLLEQLSLSSPTVTDASMKLIAGMPGLRTLWFQHCPITDRGLSILRNNSNIEHLMIRGTEATTASLRSLMTLPNLKSLDLSLESTEETPQWEDLRWFSHLERLELSGSTFRSADLTHLQGLTQLGLLSLELDQPIDDAGITSLAPLINLTGLGIYKSHVSDEGLKSLSNMTKLERLNVHCLATDEGLQALLPLKSLQSLEIASPYVKKESVTALSKQLPSVQTINHYRYRLDNSDISVSPKDRFFRRGWQAERGPQEALEGKTPPPLTVDRWRNIDGDSLSLDDLKGKVVLVYFWREPISWCRMQMLAVNALYEKYHDQGLEIIGVHSTEDADNLQFYVAKHDIHWPVCADVGSQTNTTWHVQFNSGHYLLDRNGTLRYADLFQGHLEEAVKALLAEAGPVDVSALEPPQIPLNIVIAKHVMLLEGREIVTWDEVEKKIAELPDPSLAYPHLYETRGARESGTFEESEKTFWGIREKYKLKGHSVGSLWPRTDWRYDQIESAKDLVPDESLRVEGSVVDAEGKPVADAEVILVTPVDESISYKSYHIALVEGRVRNPLEHVLTHSDDKGAFSIYPPPDTNYSIIALHPDHGFTLIRETSLVNDHRVTLLPWGGIVAELSEEPEQQVADLSTRISESDGRPEVVISQYWSDLKQEKPTLTFGFTHVPPIFDTTISRSFPNKDGGSTSVPGASVGLLPGETRRLDLGPLTKQQRERIEGTRELMERRQKERDGEETSAVQDDTGDRLVAWANRPLTDADRIVAAARAKSLGVEKLPRLQLGGTYWNAPVVGMQGLPERSLENLKVARGQPVVESERVNVRVMLGWDAPRLTQRSEMQIEDDVSINLRYWDGHEGFHGSWRETNDVRTFGRHRTIDKLMDDPQWLHFQYALTMGSELSWPGDSVRFDSKPVALTRYRHVGTEQIDNEVCDIFEGAVRHEMLWIGQSSGLIRARYDRWLHTQRPEYYTDLVQEVAGRTFDDHDRFWDWWKLQTPERQAILSAHWAVAHWALTRPGQITFFSDFKEIALGVEWPMKAERLIVQYVGRSDEDGFNYTRCETVFDVSSTNEEFDVLVTDAIPESGDVIWDWRFDIPVKYDWQPDLTESDIQTLLDAERQKLQESKQRFEAAVQPITDMVGKQAPSLPESGWLDASNAPTPESLRGRPYLLHFWATWCGPCKNELPILQSLHDDGLVVIGVHPDGGDASQDETVREFVAEQGLEYPVVLAGNVNEAIAGYPVKMYPYTIVVDAEGKVAAQGVMFGNPELIKTFRKQQRERIEGTRKLMEQRQKQAEEPNDETSQVVEPWKVRLKAIDQARGEVISRAKFEVEQLYEESEKNTRTDYSAEDDGAFVAEFETRTPDVCVLSCRAEGYTPVHGRWISPELSEEGEPLPEEVIFHMEKGVTVGGIVLNEDEEPVAGAKVLFSASNYDVAPGEKLVQTFSKDEFVTDEDGRWSCNYAPEQMTETLITVNHEDYSVDDTNYGIGKRVDELKSQQLVYYLRRPRTVYGQVTDLDGEPIESALITVGVYPEQDDPTFRTDAQGCYSIEGILVDRITVIKPGFAPSEHIFSDWPPHPFQREIDDGTAAQGELNFQLQPGVTVEIHVTDKEGKQLENANVTPTYWETSSEFRGNRIFYTKIGQQFLPDKTDEDGLWSWTWAPRDDQLKFVVSHSGYVTVHNVPFTVDKTSQTFNVELETDPSQPQILVGLVFDAETKQPIESFKVQRGYTSKNRLARPLEPERYGEGWVDWRPTSYIPGKDGRFLTNITVPFGKGKHVYRVLADGYETAIGEPVMNDDGDPVLNFELERRP